MISNPTIRRFLRSAGVLGPLQRARQMLSPGGRANFADDRTNLAHLRRAFAEQHAACAHNTDAAQVCLVYGGHTVRNVIAGAPILLAVQRAGYDLQVLLPSENVAVAEAYQIFGARKLHYLGDYLREGKHPATEHIRTTLRTTNDLKEFTYKGCRVGKFCLSTLMRWSRLGDPEIAHPATDAMLRRQLSRSLHAADAAEVLNNAVKPKLAVLNERSYSPFGEIFDTVLAQGGNCISWNAAHRNNTLILKRYNQQNIYENHFALSAPSWKRIKAMSWSDADWQRAHDEIVGSYQSGEWFGECATQLDKASLDRTALIRRLDIDPARKTVCVFPHMFWDATFFWGEDLFDNYEHWFTEVLKVARDNDKVNWIVKIHPANVAKAVRDGYYGEHSEIVAINRTLGALPPHVKLIPPDSDISTLSLLDIIDYCLTVRGTVGIEAAAFGVRVLTAGTGRYDGRGFTSDFSSVSAYLAAIRALPDVPAMAADEIELARRFAYGTFLVRPTQLRSTTLGFRRDIAATLESKIIIPGASLLEAPDVCAIAAWIESGEEDYLSLLPARASTGPEGAEALRVNV